MDWPLLLLQNSLQHGANVVARHAIGQESSQLGNDVNVDGALIAIDRFQFSHLYVVGNEGLAQFTDSEASSGGALLQRLDRADSLLSLVPILMGQGACRI